jgi:nucleotide-binding universal stress UspA family protein
MKPFRRILIATDFTPASDPALDEAIEMAKGNDTELLIAHAYQAPVMLPEQTVSAETYEERDRDLRNDVVERLQPLLGKARHEGVSARGLVLSGVPHTAIAEAAKESDADLIVMGTHGRKGVSRFFIGSVVSRVISTAPCPVMTVGGPRPDERRAEASSRLVSTSTRRFSPRERD